MPRITGSCSRAVTLPTSRGSNVSIPSGGFDVALTDEELRDVRPLLDLMMSSGVVTALAVVGGSIVDGGLSPDMVAPITAAFPIGVPLTVLFDIADAAGADYDFKVPFACEVLDVLCQKRATAAGAANTVTVKKAASALSDAISINVSDNVLARAAQIIDAQSVFAEGDILRVTVARAGGNAAVAVAVTLVRR